jgi:hypothetical protein
LRQNPITFGSNAKSASPNIRQLSSSDLIQQGIQEIGLREANLAKRD